MLVFCDMEDFFYGGDEVFGVVEVIDLCWGRGFLKIFMFLLGFDGVFFWGIVILILFIRFLILVIKGGGWESCFSLFRIRGYFWDNWSIGWWWLFYGFVWMN